MLRLSVIAPADLTSRIVDALEDDEAVSALLVQRGVAVKPAGDLITCRPFDASLELYNKGQLADLTGLSGMENFSDVAKSAWTTDAEVWVRISLQPRASRSAAKDRIWICTVAPVRLTGVDPKCWRLMA